MWRSRQACFEIRKCSVEYSVRYDYAGLIVSAVPMLKDGERSPIHGRSACALLLKRRCGMHSHWLKCTQATTVSTFPPPSTNGI